MKVDARARIEIEWHCSRLIHLYANLNDAADWEATAALYAPNGVMTRPTAPDHAIVGRDAILAALRARPPRATRHICSNVVIDVESATEARGESAMLLFTAADTSPLIGTFRDRFVLTPEGWRFTRRDGTLLFGR